MDVQIREWIIHHSATLHGSEWTPFRSKRSSFHLVLQLAYAIEMATENIVNRPGIVYYSCTHSDGTSSLEQATALFGSVVHGIVGNNNSDDVIALTEKGVFDLNTSKIISDSEFITFSCGYNHCVGSLGNHIHSRIYFNVSYPIVAESLR